MKCKLWWDSVALSSAFTQDFKLKLTFWAKDWKQKGVFLFCFSFSAEKNNNNNKKTFRINSQKCGFQKVKFFQEEKGKITVVLHNKSHFLRYLCRKNIFPRPSGNEPREADMHKVIDLKGAVGFHSSCIFRIQAVYVQYKDTFRGQHKPNQVIQGCTNR